MNNPPSAILPDADLAGLIVANAVEYAIFTMDQGGVITSWSPGAAAIFGYEAGEAVGMGAGELFTPSDRAAGVDRVELDKAMDAGRVEDSRWHLRRDQSRFWANGVTMRCQPAGPFALLKILRDETPSKLAEQQRVLLLNELNHRVKNTLVTVQSIAEQTLRAGGVEAETRRNLSERLLALSEAHDVLLQENWAGADLAAIVEQAALPHRQSDRQRFQVDGPAARLHPQQAVGVSLVLHELITNAVKYGALSTSQGQVAITWNVSQDGEGRRYLTLLWREAGGPSVAQPTRRGFGTRLIERSFGAETRGHARLVYEPEGVCCVIEITLSSEAEIPTLDPAGSGPAA